MGFFGFGKKARDHTPEQPDGGKQELTKRELERQKVIVETDGKLTGLAKKIENEHPEIQKYETLIA